MSEDAPAQKRKFAETLAERDETAEYKAAFKAEQVARNAYKRAVLRRCIAKAKLDAATAALNGRETVSVGATMPNMFFDADDCHGFRMQAEENGFKVLASPRVSEFSETKRLSFVLSWPQDK